MVMGRTHLGDGACAVTLGACSLVVLGWTGGIVAHPSTAALFVLVCLAHFLRPDIDHHRALATRCFGLWSELEHKLWCTLAERYYAATRGPGDPVAPRIHRGLTHTPVGAVLFGVQSLALVALSQPLCAALSGVASRPLLASPYAPLWGSGAGGFAEVSGWLAGLLAAQTARTLGAFLLLAGAWPLIGIVFCGACAALIAAPYAWAHRAWWGIGGLLFGIVVRDSLADDWFWVGLAAVLGSYGHDLGDGCTESGCPLKHPLAEVVDTPNGQAISRWVDHGTPRWLRYPAGSRRESWWFGTLITATAGVVVLTAAIQVSRVIA